MRAAEAEAVIAALRRPRYEVLPLDGIADSVAEHLPDDVTITVTASPSKGMASTLTVAESLAGQGRHVVPHIAARLISDEVHLKDVVQRLANRGIQEAFVIAGDVKEPAGRFQGALDLLTAMAEADCRLERVGIAGYPQSHPFIDDDVTIQSMWDKRRFASYIVSQICFRPKVVAGWVRRVRRRGVDLPVHVGVPGALDPARLVRISSRIGVEASARFAKHHATWLPHLLRIGGYHPGLLVEGLAPSLADPNDRVAGFHFYTFNELARTERWRQQTLARLSASA
ncbi:MAG TPA: methylenetetrahydrofolate reductase [Actinomycetes bacterium]